MEFLLLFSKNLSNVDVSNINDLSDNVYNKQNIMMFKSHINVLLNLIIKIFIELKKLFRHLPIKKEYSELRSNVVKLMILEPLTEVVPLNH